MKTRENKNLCPMCGGRKVEGKTVYSVDLGNSLVVVRNVVAQICEQCGEEWISDQNAKELEHIVEGARREKRQVEIMTM